MATKRIKGAGTIYRRAADGLWCASVEMPPVDGKRKRRVIVNKSEEVVRARLAEIMEGRTLAPVLTRQEKMQAARAIGSHTAWERDKARRDAPRHCRYCHVKLNYFNATQDHIIPVAHGGSDAIENLQWICWECNNAKGDKLTYTYRGLEPRKQSIIPSRRAEYAAMTELERRVLSR